MRSSPTLYTLLESDLEPTRNDYADVARSTIDDPKQISNLVQDDKKEETLVHLIAHSGRLTYLFHCLCDSQKQLPDRRHRTTLIKDHITSEIVILFVELLPAFAGIIEDDQAIELLISALENCLLSQSPSLRKLARALADNGNLLEHLASDESGGETLHRWVTLPITAIQDATILGIWTQRLVDLVNLCPGQHGIHNEIQRWKTLVGLKSVLHDVQEKMEQKSQSRAQRSSHDIPVSSAHMIALGPDDKKSYIARGQEKTEAMIQVDENFHEPIREFGLRIPSTRSELEQAISTLEGEATISILRAVTRTYPCKLCKEALRAAISRTNVTVAPTSDKSPPTLPPVEVEIFGKPIGIWKVLLSVQARKSLQGLSRSGGSSFYFES